MPRKPAKSKVRNRVVELKAMMPKITDVPESSMAAFVSFPEKVAFDTQEPEESIVLLLRQHPAVLIPKLAIVILLFLVPFIVVPLVKSSGISLGFSEVTFGLALGVMWAMGLISFCATTFFHWFFSANIVTTERLVDIDFSKVYTHSVAECKLENVEDVTHRPVGMWASIFDFGTVYIQTAAEQREFEFDNVPRPRDVQDTITDLIEWKDGPNK